MERPLKNLFSNLKKGRYDCKDAHIIRFFSSYVLICDGKAVEVTDPYLAYCPLAGVLYKGINSVQGVNSLKQFIEDSINKKTDKFKHFSHLRELKRTDIAVPYGASEILMYGLKEKTIDAACVVCDGCGTVVVDKPEIAQGIGARMNGLFFTSPIAGIIERLEASGSRVLSPDADIDQVKGVKKAVSLGYKKIAVTVNASMDGSFKRLRELEKKAGISLIILAVCTTGISPKRVRHICGYSDMVWSCASNEVRKTAGRKAILQLSTKIPVFVLSAKGLDLIKAYSPDGYLIANLNTRNQYLIAKGNRGKNIKIGNFDACLSQVELPVRDKGEPICA